MLTSEEIIEDYISGTCTYSFLLEPNTDDPKLHVNINSVMGEFYFSIDGKASLNKIANLLFPYATQ